MIVFELEGHGDYHQMYAYISIDENGKSGICATKTRLGLTPMVGMTRRDMDKFKPAVKELRDFVNSNIVLIKYKNGEVISE